MASKMPTQKRTAQKHSAPQKGKAGKLASQKLAAAKKAVANKAAASKVAPAKPVQNKIIVNKMPPKPVAPPMRTPLTKRPLMKPVLQKSPAENDNVNFTKGDFVVYPAHGVGQIEGVETHTIGGMEVSLYAIGFEKDRMRLKIPVMKAKTSGLRRLSTGERLQDALKTLKGRSRVRRTMWSRRAQEYEMKINSGDPIAIAEVLRDLKRSSDDSEQSYSERQIYQSALERLAREVAAVERTTEAVAVERLEGLLGTAAANNTSVKVAPPAATAKPGKKAA